MLDLDSDVLDRNFHQTLYQGLLLNLKQLFLVLIAVATFYFSKSSFKIFLSSKIKKNYKNGRKIAEIKKTLRFKNRKNNRLERQYRPAINKSVGAIVVLVVLIFVLAHFERKGKLFAEDVKASIIENRFNSVTFVEYSDVKKIAYLYCGSRNCAGMDVETNEIVYFQQNGHRIKRFVATEI